MATWHITTWHMRKSRSARCGAVALCAVALWGVAGCRGDRDDKPPHQFFPDMDDAPKWKPQVETEFFADGRSMRPVVPGTVPFARWAYVDAAGFSLDRTDAFADILDRADLLKEDDALFRGISGTAPDGKPVYLKTIPIPVDAALLKRGQERYNIYCVVCHGYAGRGDGMVGQKWTAKSVANFHDPKYTNPQEPDHKGDDGFFFYTAMNGVPGADGFPGEHDDDQTRVAKMKAMKMPPYAHALTEHDAWAIVAYIRALQMSQGLSLQDVPASERPRLEQEKAKMRPPAPPPAAAPTGASGATGAAGATQPKGSK
jgi:mono/diheme cytochrome c family protein